MMKTMKKMLGLAAVLALSLCANRALAGLPHGGDLSGNILETVTLNGGKFYNLTADTTIDLRNDVGLVRSGIEISGGTVVINLNGHNLTVYGSPGQGRVPGAAGVHLPGGATLYVVGHGTFLARGGDPGNGGNGGNGGDGIRGGGRQVSGSGGEGGTGGGGGGASVGTRGAYGGEGTDRVAGHNYPHDNGERLAGSGAAAGGHAEGSKHETGSHPDYTGFGTFRVVTATVKTEFPTLKNGLDGVGGAGGGHAKYSTGGVLGAFETVHTIGGGGGGGGGAAGRAPTSVLGCGGTGGGGGGGGGSGGLNAWDDIYDINMIGGGYGGSGAEGTGSGANGANAHTEKWGVVDGGLLDGFGLNWFKSGGAGESGGSRTVAPTKSMTMEPVSATGIADTQYVVALDLQGGTGAKSVTCYLGEVPGKIAVPVRSGCTFLGYYTEAYGKGTRYFNADGSFNAAHVGNQYWNTDLTKLYACWSYTVTFEKVGGAGGDASAMATYDDVLPSVLVPGRTGYTFLGYFDAATGGVKYYNAEGSGVRVWNKTEPATLYAQWAGNAFVITLPDGTKVDVTYGQRAPNVKPVAKTGYTFNGYGDVDGNKYYNADGTPTGETWATASDVTLVPLFTANSYAVTLNPNGGSGGTPDVTATYDAAMPKVEVPALAGHTFLGYFDAAEGGKQYYDNAGSSMANWDKAAAATLYAQWEVKTFTLTFDQQGGADGTEYALVEYLAALPKVKIPALTGHTFLGYFDGLPAATDEDPAPRKWYEPNGGSTNVYEWLENTTLYARWKANSYKYVLDGGAFTGEQAVVYGRVPANIRVPKSEENVFMGYFDEAGNMVYDAEGKYVGGAGGYLVAGNTRLTAMWSEKPEVIAMVGTPKQRWPWNGKYDIAYTAESLKEKKSYVVNVELTVTEPDAAETVTYTRLVQIPSENGEHTLMADFGGFVAPETLDANATIRLRLFLSDKEEK